MIDVRTKLAFLLAISVSISGCDRPPASQADAVAGEASSGPHAVRFLALGDSYTIGESVAPADRWPVQLAGLLRSRGVDVADPTIIAHTGWTTSELSNAIDIANPAGSFGLITLLVGVNDQYRGGNAHDYRPRFIALLKRSIAFAGGEPKHVIVLSIPDWGAMPVGQGAGRERIGKEIDSFNDVDREECKKLGVMFVDVTPVSREAATQPDLGASDGLHPSGKQYTRWARLANDALRATGQ